MFHVSYDGKSYSYKVIRLPSFPLRYSQVSQPQRATLDLADILDLTTLEATSDYENRSVYTYLQVQVCKTCIALATAC